MTTVVSQVASEHEERTATGGVRPRAGALAERLQQGAHALATFAGTLTPTQWQTRVPGDGRRIGVIVHHVASVYPLEIQLAQTVAGGTPITGVTMADVDAMNAKHAAEHDGITKAEALNLLRRNSEVAAGAIRAFTDEQLDRAESVSLYADATLTAQFVLEDHAVRHSYHHLSRIRKALES